MSPLHLYPKYKSTILRCPTKPLVPVAAQLKDLTLPAFGASCPGKWDNDLAKNARNSGEPIGERIRVAGKVMDEDGRALRNMLVKSGRPMRPVVISTRRKFTMRHSTQTFSAQGAC